MRQAGVRQVVFDASRLRRFARDPRRTPPAGTREPNPSNPSNLSHQSHQSNLSSPQDVSVFMRSKAVIVAAVFAAGVSFAACDINAGEGHGFSVDFASGKAQDTWTRSYPLPAGGRIELINVNGRIDAEPASGNQVEVSGVR